MTVRPVLIRVLGVAIVLASLVFVVERIVATRVWAIAEPIGATLAPALLVGAIVYASSIFLLAYGWVHLLTWCREPRRPTAPYLALYARTQVAKYIPGNIFHFVGRHVMGRRLGIGHGAMIWAMVLENIGLALGATLPTLIGLWFWMDLEIGVRSGVLAAIAGGLLLAPLVLAQGLPRLGAMMGVEAQPRRVGDIVAGLARPYACYVGFFLVSGAILWAIATTIAGAPPSSMPMIVSAATAAWIVGFITPGSPGGIGVREAVLITALSTSLGEQNATLLAISFRAVTLAGDVFAFALSYPLMVLARRASARAASTD